MKWLLAALVVFVGSALGAAQAIDTFGGASNSTVAAKDIYTVQSGTNVWGEKTDLYRSDILQAMLVQRLMENGQRVGSSDQRLLAEISTRQTFDSPGIKEWFQAGSPRLDRGTIAIPTVEMEFSNAVTINEGSATAIAVQGVGSIGLEVNSAEAVFVIRLTDLVTMQARKPIIGRAKRNTVKLDFLELSGLINKLKLPIPNFVIARAESEQNARQRTGFIITALALADALRQIDELPR